MPSEMPPQMRMRAMVLAAAGTPLESVEQLLPEPGPDQVLVQVRACGVCRTDLHVIDGELASPNLPLVPGHEIIGTVVRLGDRAGRFRVGDRIGIPWLARACGLCDFCLAGRENLCDRPLFTGYTVDGGYAEYTAAYEAFCFPIPPSYSDAEAAPLLCAGLIGYRSLRMAGDARRIGLYGFGAAAHIIAQVATYEQREVFAFTRAGDTATQDFARSLGATWAGSSDERPPTTLDAAIIFAPAGELVPRALDGIAKGGTVVCAGIHMSDIPSFAYSKLWGERVIRSVANLTRRDGEEFLAIAPKIPIRTEVQPFPLSQANEALTALKHGSIHGAAVLVP